MNQPRFEWKVGLFVFSGLVLLALLVLNFSKGVTLFQSTYKVHVIMQTVAGLKPSADVMMAGVAIGKVAATTLSADGRRVDIDTEILSKYRIRKDSHFRIDSIGFLGDQYVAVVPPETRPSPGQDYLKDGDTVTGDNGFDLQQALLSTAGLLDSAKQALKDIDQAVTRLNQTVLSAQTLTNLSLSLSNLEFVSGQAVTLAGGVQDLLKSNAPPVSLAITNLQEFAQKLNRMADKLDQILAENRPELATAVKNFRDVSATFKQLAADLQAGKGMAGGLLRDDQIKARFGDLLTNADALAASLSIFGSNLDQKGIWRMLWKPKEPPGNSAARPVP
jgi:phospholipid/cholesterol/gamma-HCH transport system substrate-binding protein